MKLELTKEWFEAHLPHDNPEVGVGVPTQKDDTQFLSSDEEVFVEVPPNAGNDFRIPSSKPFVVAALWRV